MNKIIFISIVFIFILIASLLVATGQTAQNIVIDTDNNQPKTIKKLEITETRSVEASETFDKETAEPTGGPGPELAIETLASPMLISLPTRDPLLLNIARGTSQEINTADLLLDFIPTQTKPPIPTVTPATTGPVWTTTPQPVLTTIVTNFTPIPTADNPPQPVAPPPVPNPGAGDRLIIPAINVNAPITAVGLDASGNMAAPAGWFDIAWYRYGAKPGEPGSAAMAGHLDTNTGDPSTFWDLNLLSVGDQIIYQALDGQQIVFIVEETGLYPWNQIPLERVFSRTGDPRISLITCGGLWSQQHRNYSHRTIVFARMSK